MKKIISTLLLVLMSMSCFAADVARPGAAMYVTIGTNIIWNNLTSNYILDAMSPASGVCLTFIDNVATPFGFNLAVFGTPNLSNTTYTGNTGAWVQHPISPPAATASPQYTVPASGTLQLYIRIPSAAHYVLSFSSPTASASNTVTIFAVQTPSACGGVNQWAVGASTAGGGTLNTATTIQAAVAGVRHVANCVTVSAAGTATASANVVFAIRDGGTAGSCAGTVLWNFAIGYGTLAAASEGPNGSGVTQCGLNVSSSAGSSLQLCASNAIAGVIEAGSMSGYDQ